MSLRRLGTNPDGTRQVVDDGPAYARRQGHGGSAMGAFSGTVLKVGPSTEVRQEAQRKRREQETRHE